MKNKRVVLLGLMVLLLLTVEVKVVIQLVL
nr:MAG TPA: hypothetical protein [Bacteriophage sp.]